MENNIFSLNRFIKFFNRQIKINSSNLVIAILAISGTLFIINFLIAFGNKSCDYESQAYLYLTIFFITGFIFSSRVFSELDDYRTGYMYLTLPVSNFERLLAGWLSSSVLFSIVGFAVLIVITHLANLLAASLFNFQFEMFNFFKVRWLEIFGVYMVTQTIFILGSAFFKKQAFLKTLLSIFIIVFTIQIIAGFLGFGIIGEFKIVNMNFNDSDFPIFLKDFFENTFSKIMEIIFWYLTAPFFLIASYFKLKEVEI